MVHDKVGEALWLALTGVAAWVSWEGERKWVVTDVDPRRFCQSGDNVTGFAERGSFMVASESLSGVEHEAYKRGLSYPALDTIL